MCYVGNLLGITHFTMSHLRMSSLEDFFLENIKTGKLQKNCIKYHLVKAKDCVMIGGGMFE